MSEPRASRQVPLGAWIAIGAGLGTALGVVMDNIGLWLAIGVAIGVVLGSAISRAGKGGQ